MLFEIEVTLNEFDFFHPSGNILSGTLCAIHRIISDFLYQKIYLK